MTAALVRGRRLDSAHALAGVRRVARVFRTDDAKALKQDLEALVDSLMTIGVEYAAPAFAFAGPYHENASLDFGVVSHFAGAATPLSATLPPATAAAAGRMLGCIVESGTVNVLPRGDSLVQGAASDSLAAVGLYLYLCDGVDWWRAV